MRDASLLSAALAIVCFLCPTGCAEVGVPGGGEETDTGPGSDADTDTDTDSDTDTDVDSDTDADTDTDTDTGTDTGTDTEPDTCTGEGDCAEELFCVDGYCCDGACDGTCEACDVAGSEGRCTPFADGEDPDEECAPETPLLCGQNGSCDGASGCALYGPETECSDGVFCNGMETCSGSGACAAPAAPACAEDGLICTPTLCNETTDQCNAPNAGTCAIGDACYGNEAANPSNPCQECDVSVSQAAWTNDDTNSCNDGFYCNGAESCSAGSCSSAGNPCTADALSCTTTCTEGTGAAICNAVTAGSCLIDGACYAEGAVRTGFPCQECMPGTSQIAWSGDVTNTCANSNYCDGIETCSASGACADNADPCTPDANDCTITCVESTDQCNVLAASSCIIGGACYAEGSANPANLCQECNPTADPDGWTTDTGNSCDDGLFCTGAESCATGSCVSGGNPCSPDGLDCTTDCTEASGGSCSYTVAAGSCLIGGTCYATGTPRPGYPCQECVSTTNQTNWTNDNTNTCADGNVCTEGDHCSGGSCAAGTACAAITCESGNCDDGTQECDPTDGCVDCLADGDCASSYGCDTDNDICSNGCPGSVWTSNNHCYWYVSSGATWDAAESACVAEGGHLASITSAEENVYILGVAGGDAWFGLRDYATASAALGYCDDCTSCCVLDSNGGHYTGSNATYDDWYLMCGPTGYGDSLVLIYISALQYWVFSTSGSDYNTVMEGINGYGDCGGYNYCLSDGSLYDVCDDDSGAGSASLLISNITTAGWYVFAVDGWAEGNWWFDARRFQFTDGTAHSYVNWQAEQPDNAGNSEDCAQLYDANGYWNDLPCTSTLPYVCEKAM